MKTIHEYLIIWHNYTCEYFIKEDWTILNKFGKLLIFPFWAIRSIFTYILSFTFFPFVMISFRRKFDGQLSDRISEITTNIDNDVAKIIKL